MEYSDSPKSLKSNENKSPLIKCTLPNSYLPISESSKESDYASDSEFEEVLNARIKSRTCYIKK